jgi:2-C-methyl-D-erythritol 4-phosphate cytidylyltransferase
MCEVTIIIPAGGSSSRLGGEVPKQFRELAGTPLLQRVVALFGAMSEVSQIIAAVPPDYIGRVQAYPCRAPLTVVPGGSTRAASVFYALSYTSCADDDVVLVHDAARPFVTHAEIRAVATAARENGAAIAAAPLADTIKRVNASNIIEETPPRAGLYRALTPQGFTHSVIQKAYSAAYHADATDDASLAEAIGHPVRIVECSSANFKITTAADWRLAEAMCNTL